MKNKEGCDTKVRILALERILQSTDEPPCIRRLSL